MSRKYNALFILPAALSDEDVQKTLQNVQESVSKLNGTATNVDVLGKRMFARPLQKQDTGHYVKMQIDIAPESIDALIARVKLNENVFRMQILRDEGFIPTARPTAPDLEADNG
jgi:small subunit ribosomal protein S6